MTIEEKNFPRYHNSLWIVNKTFVKSNRNLRALYNSLNNISHVKISRTKSSSGRINFITLDLLNDNTDMACGGNRVLAERNFGDAMRSEGRYRDVWRKDITV